MGILAPAKAKRRFREREGKEDVERRERKRSTMLQGGTFDRVSPRKLSVESLKAFVPTTGSCCKCCRYIRCMHVYTCRYMYSMHAHAHTQGNRTYTISERVECNRIHFRDHTLGGVHPTRSLCVRTRERMGTADRNTATVLLDTDSYYLNGLFPRDSACDVH